MLTLRDPSRTRVPLPPRGRRRWVLLLAVGAALAALVPFAAQVAAVPGWINPFQQQTVDRSPSPLVNAIRDVAQFRAATGSFQVLVDVEHDTPNVPSVISGERTTFFATGRVDSVVDLSAMDDRHIAVSADRRSVTITLPPPVLEPAIIDPAQSRIVGQQRGIVDRVEGMLDQIPEGDRELYLVAAQKVDAAAAGSELPARAEENTRRMLTGLAGSLGFDQVTVVFSTPRT